MNNSKLIKLIGSLSEKEVREFSKYLKSPFFNRDQNIIRLFQQIRKFKHLLDSPKLQKEKMFKKLFPGAPFSLRKINDVMSDLSLKLEDYLIYLEQKAESNERDIYYLRALKRRKLDHLYFKKLNNTLIQLEQKEIRDTNYFYQQFLLRKDEYLHPNKSNFNRATQKSDTKDPLDPLLLSLDKFYFSSKLRFYGETIAQQGVSQKKYPLFLMQEIQTLITESKQFKDPLFEIYSLLSELQKGKNDVIYNKLKRLIIENKSIVEKEELIDLCAGLNHYNINFTSDFKEILENYKLIIEWDLLVFEGYISPDVFINIVNSAITFSEFEWVEEFIKSHIDYIESNRREDIHGFALAKLSFSKKDYWDSIQHVLKISPHSFSLNLNSRMLEIQCYYELQDPSLVSDCCNKFYKHLSRSSELYSEHIKTCINAFLKYVRLIIKPAGERPTKEMILAELADEELIYNRAWLTKSIEVFKN